MSRSDEVRASELKPGMKFRDGRDALIVQSIADAPSGWVRLRCVYRDDININTVRALPTNERVEVLS